MPRATKKRIPVYDVRLVESRKPLCLAESTLVAPDAAVRIVHELLGHSDREEMAALFLDGRGNIVGCHMVAMGGQHRIGAVEPRPLLRAALLACASAIVLGHNHPSGDPTPSDEDLTCTQSLVDAANVMGIAVLDHVIVTRAFLRHYSMHSAGCLPRPREVRPCKSGS